MQIISFSHHGSPSWGALIGDKIHDLGSLTHTNTFGEALLAQVADAALAQIDQAPTILRNDIQEELNFGTANKVLCVGTNYDGHMREMGRTKPDFPVIFTRFIDSFVPHNAALRVPEHSDTLDFEVELAVVIGKPGRHIAPNEALNHVWGYTVLNDGSVREFQRQTHQFTAGKNYFATGSIGPTVVDAATFGPIGEQKIVTVLNGETVQSDQLNSMMFTIPEIIAYISQWTPLRPGDVIATGTPEGVGAARTPQRWLRDQDRLEFIIEGIEPLVNIVTERP